MRFGNFRCLLCLLLTAILGCGNEPRPTPLEEAHAQMAMFIQQMVDDYHKDDAARANRQRLDDREDAP